LIFSRTFGLAGGAIEPVPGLIIVVKTKVLKLGVKFVRKEIIIDGLGDKEEGFVLRIIFIKVPKLLFGLPPLNNSTETGHSEKNLDVPVPAVPIRMFFPGLTDILNPLNQGLTYFWLSGKLSNRHVGNIRGNAYKVVEGSHDGINGIVDEDTGGTPVDSGRDVIAKTGVAGDGRERRSRARC
jgi:hypothetical protein